MIGLYLNPPEKALVLCVDEKSQIQALNRTQPLLPLRPGLPARMTHDYKRNGTTSLFAALEVATGKVHGKCYKRHTHEVCGVSAVDCRPASRARNPPDLRQLRYSQTPSRRGVAGAASPVPHAIYSHLTSLELGVLPVDRQIQLERLEWRRGHLGVITETARVNH